MHVSPHTSQRNNLFERINESTIVLLSIVYYGLSAAVPSGEQRADMGNIFIIIVLISILINVMHFFGETLHCFHLLMKYFWNRVCNRFGFDDQITYKRPQGALAWKQVSSKKAIVRIDIKKLDPSDKHIKLNGKKASVRIQTDGHQGIITIEDENLMADQELKSDFQSANSRHSEN